MRAALAMTAAIAAAVLVLASCSAPAPPVVTAQSSAPPATTTSHLPKGETSLRFTASGDVGAGSDSAAVLEQISSLAADLHLSLGDLSYGEAGAEQSWCDFVTSRTGVGFPFELVAGNHDSDGLNGHVDDFAACLPNELPGLVGEYGRQYYVDVPEVNPLVRIVMISPDLTFPNGSWSYTSGSEHYQWTEAAIAGARSAGIPWVVAGMHKPCLSVGRYDCGPGADLLNLLVGDGVDLVLSGHEHIYARSKQLALGSSCAAINPGTYTAGCVVDDDNELARGAGTVMAIAGTGGTDLREVNPGDAEAGYFAAYSGLNLDPSHGNLEVTVTAKSLAARFVPVVGGTFTDAFSITDDPTPPG